MSIKPADIKPGHLFSRLVVVAFAGQDKWGNPMWLCHCRCGNKTTVTAQHLASRHSKSCGCSRVAWRTGGVREMSSIAWKKFCESLGNA